MLRPIAIRTLHFTCALGLVGASSADPESAAGEQPGKPEIKSEQATPDKAEEEEGGGLQAAKFMPLGRPNLQVKIPQFEDGELQCVMNAMEMTRVDDNEIEIKSMDIQFIEDGQSSTRIEFLDAQYNLEDRLLRTDKRAVVQRADFTLVGESLRFDTVEQRGKMVGKVRMVIHDSAGLSGKKEQKEEAKSTNKTPVGLSVAEAARMIARVAELQQRRKATTQD